jgi:cytochrome c2
VAYVLRFLTLSAVVAVLSTPAAALDGNVDAGKKVFTKCAVCHGIGDTKKQIGPTLNNVIGRVAGTEPDFLAKKGAGFSKALINAGAAGLVWNETELASWLADPKAKVPGTKMVFVGLKKEQEIADVIAYVKSFTAQ